MLLSIWLVYKNILLYLTSFKEHLLKTEIGTENEENVQT